MANLPKDMSSLRAKIEALQPILETQYRAHIDGIFGSYATGTASEKSDLDLLVTFLPHANLFQSVALDDFLSKELHVSVDIVSRRAIRKAYEKDILETTKWL